ncbi:MAG: hypothetical protein QME32_03500 [Endomicrobiia bacterium]|nr:hypothetical protein [Endomicrobiia bacterium]
MNDNEKLKELLASVRGIEPRAGFRRSCLEAAEKARENKLRMSVLAPTGIFALLATAGLTLTILSVLRISVAAKTPDAQRAIFTLAAQALPAARQRTVSSLHNCFSALEECAKCARGECAHRECGGDGATTRRHINTCSEGEHQ